MKRILIAVLVVLLNQFLVIAESSANEDKKLFEQGWSDFKKGEYAKALPKIKIVAEKGYPGAMYLIGDMYGNGLGTEKNLDLAEQWYVKAIAKTTRDLDSEMLNLGIQFYFGDRVRQDYNKALYWFNEADKSGNAFAAHSIGIYHMDIAKNYQQALQWFEKAAKQEQPDSQLMLCGLYGLSKNTDIPRNFTMGRFWCNRVLSNKKTAKGDKDKAQEYLKRIDKLERLVKKIEPQSHKK